MISPIAVIGRGAWGAKVTESLRRNFPNIQIDPLSSRSYLKHHHRQCYGNIWIAAQPGLQLEILNIAKNHAHSIILEKPISMLLSDFVEIEKVVQDCSIPIELSRPWCFTDAWQTTLNNVKEWNFDGGHISFVRKSPKKHSNISMLEDWLPHDVNLAAQIIKSLEDDWLEERIARSRNEERIEIRTSKGTLIDFCISESEDRISNMKINCQSGNIFIDLISQSAILNNQPLSVVPLDNFDAISRNFLAATSADKETTLSLIRTHKKIHQLIYTLPRALGK